MAALRDEFNIILKAISDMGQIERECRNLQDQIEIEISKEIGVKLERVSADLLQLQKETQSLMKYSHGWKWIYSMIKYLYTEYNIFNKQ